MQRRKFLTNGTQSLLGTWAMLEMPQVLAGCISSRKSSSADSYAGAPDFSQKALPYDFKALEPVVDAATMEIHYTKHAAAYTKNMKEAMDAEMPQAKTLEDLLAQVGKWSAKMRNNAGGHYNHESYWKWMTPGGKALPASLQSAIEKDLGSVGDLRNKFIAAATSQFGSGWAWLVLNNKKQLQIGSTPNQDNPLMDVSTLKGYPLLGVDVWEHAYYLKYQNRRADYLNAWWNIINWDEVNARYNFALAKM